jgi:aminodeoxyfutalosine deaminase
MQILSKILKYKPDFPLDLKQFSSAFPVNGLNRFWEWWKAIKPIESEYVNYWPILMEHLKRLKHQNVKYAELTIPVGNMDNNIYQFITDVQLLREVTDAITYPTMQVEFLLPILRNKDLAIIEKTAERACALAEKNLIAGISVCGPEKNYPVRRMSKILDSAHRYGLQISIHAGEREGPNSVWDALEYGNPSRIGHGLAVFKDDGLISEIHNANIHIEMCITSNLKTNAISRLSEHPVRIARDHNIPFSINTDDPGIFGCSMTSEYNLLVREFDFSLSDLEKLYADTISSGFGQSPIRN